MAHINQNTKFICFHCGNIVEANTSGGYRNHCPFCLYSLHLDIKIGDRKSDCKGLMYPKKIIFNSNKGYQIIHHCQSCGFERPNKIDENSKQKDDVDLIIDILSKTM